MLRIQNKLNIYLATEHIRVKKPSQYRIEYYPQLITLSFPYNRNHDYENLALININRNPLGQNSKNLVSHWRTYSNMADDNHDESTAYEKRNYYDIYPLSKELKLQLYRSLTPLSTVSI